MYTAVYLRIRISVFSPNWESASVRYVAVLPSTDMVAVSITLKGNFDADIRIFYDRYLSKTRKPTSSSAGYRQARISGVTDIHICRYFWRISGCAIVRVHPCCGGRKGT